MSQQPHILMCPPDFYGIEYEINPWMNTERQADHPTAVAAVEVAAASRSKRRGREFRSSSR